MHNRFDRSAWGEGPNFSAYGYWWRLVSNRSEIQRLNQFLRQNLSYFEFHTQNVLGLTRYWLANKIGTPWTAEGTGFSQGR